VKCFLIPMLISIILWAACKDSVSQPQENPRLVYLGESVEEPAFHDFELRNPSAEIYYYYGVSDSIIVYEMQVKEGEGWTRVNTYFGDLPTELFRLAAKVNIRFQVFPPRRNLPYRIAVGLYGADKILQLQLWSNPVE
jgi:hypothetical protein